MNACCVNQSVFYQLLHTVSDGVFKRNFLQWNNISLKYAQIVVLLQVKYLIQITVKLNAEKVMYKFLSYIKQPFEGARNIVHENDIVQLAHDIFKIY